jgi:hypothetical protein
MSMTEEDTNTTAEFNFEAEGTSKSNSTEAEGKHGSFVSSSSNGLTR